jgi:hypothetical protein
MGVQRRGLADTTLTATPGPARDWLSIAQAFAGRATSMSG